MNCETGIRVEYDHNWPMCRRKWVPQGLRMCGWIASVACVYRNVEVSTDIMVDSRTRRSTSGCVRRIPIQMSLGCGGRDRQIRRKARGDGGKE